MSEEKLICNYKQKGFCKYCLQCTKEHVNKIYAQFSFSAKSSHAKYDIPRSAQRMMFMASASLLTVYIYIFMSRMEKTVGLMH